MDTNIVFKNLYNYIEILLNIYLFGNSINKLLEKHIISYKSLLMR